MISLRSEGQAKFVQAVRQTLDKQGKRNPKDGGEGKLFQIVDRATGTGECIGPLSA